MNGLKAYQINDCDTYAGRDLEEAIQSAIELTGVPRDEIFEPSVACEANPETPVLIDPEGAAKEYTTIGAIVAQMTKPGLVWSAEY